MKLILTILPLLFFCSCKHEQSNLAEGEKDIIIAQVGDKILYKSRIADLFNSEISEEEQDVLVKGFVSNWIREQLMIDEAEKNIPTDINIKKLVDDYRSSLILNYYENKLVNELLDTFVSSSQKQTYYEKSKNEFILSESLFKGIVFIVPKSKVDKKLKKALANNDIPQIYNLVGEGIEGKIIDTSKWYTLNSVLGFLPPSKVKESTLRQKGDHSFTFKNYQYFVKTIDFVSKGQPSPLTYIEAKITQIILNNRKKALISRKKQQLYDQNYSNNRIIINLE